MKKNLSISRSTFIPLARNVWFPRIEADPTFKHFFCNAVFLVTFQTIVMHSKIVLSGRCCITWTWWSIAHVHPFLCQLSHLRQGRAPRRGAHMSHPSSLRNPRSKFPSSTIVSWMTDSFHHFVPSFCQPIMQPQVMKCGQKCWCFRHHFGYRSPPSQRTSYPLLQIIRGYYLIYNRPFW